MKLARSNLILSRKASRLGWKRSARELEAFRRNRNRNRKREKKEKSVGKNRKIFPFRVAHFVINHLDELQNIECRLNVVGLAAFARHVSLSGSESIKETSRPNGTHGIRAWLHLDKERK